MKNYRFKGFVICCNLLIHKWFVFLLFVLLPGCLDNLQSELYPDTSTLEPHEITFLPSEPHANDEIKLIFYDCHYYFTSSITRNLPDIYISKKYNSQLKWPCKLVYDTISLGTLKKGVYTIELNIYDTNPMVKDSLYFSTSKKLVVSR